MAQPLGVASPNRTMALALAFLVAPFALPAPRAGGEGGPRKPAPQGASAEHLSIAIASYKDPPDQLEQDLMRVLGSVSWLDYILQPATPEELFDALQKLNDNGRKIDRIIFAGHGSSDTPHVKMRGLPGEDEGGLEPRHVDIFYARSYYKERAERLKSRRAEACIAAAKPSSGGQEPLRPSAAMEKQTHKLSAELPGAKRRLEILETLSDVMNPGAQAVLLNCSPAATAAGREFVANLGKVLMGRNGGVIRASRSDLTVFEVESLLVSWATGQQIGEYSIQASWAEFEVPGGRHGYLSEEKGLAPYVDVRFDPPCVTAAPGERIELRPVVDTMRDSGRLTYRWDGAQQPSLNPTYALDVPAEAEAPLQVPVRVRDERGREGQAVLTVLLADKPSKNALRATPQASARAPGRKGWYLEGPVQIDKGSWKDGACSFGFNLAISDGAATGSQSWRDCSNQSKCSGTYKGSVTWRQPPPFMHPGDSVSFTATTAPTSAQNTCGYRNIGSGVVIKINGGTIVQSGESRWSGPPTATTKYTVPAGLPGARMIVEVALQAASLNGKATYSYVYR